MIKSKCLTDTTVQGKVNYDKDTVHSPSTVNYDKTDYSKLNPSSTRTSSSILWLVTVDKDLCSTLGYDAPSGLYALTFSGHVFCIFDIF